MKTTLKSISTLLTGSLLLLTAPASQAGNLSINIGYHSHGHHGYHLPYGPAAHPVTHYYSPLRFYYYGRPSHYGYGHNKIYYGHGHHGHHGFNRGHHSFRHGHHSGHHSFRGHHSRSHGFSHR